MVRESPTGLPGLTVIGDRRDAAAVVEALEGGRPGRGVWTEVDPRPSRPSGSRPGRRSSARTSPRRTCRRRSAATTGRSASSKGATWARRPSLGSMRWGTSTRSSRGSSSSRDRPVRPPGSTARSGRQAGRRGHVGRRLAGSRGCPVALGLIRTSHADRGDVVAGRGHARRPNRSSRPSATSPSRGGR